MTKKEQEVLFKKFDRDVKKRSRLLRLLLATDQWFSVLLWNSSQDETISSNIHRRQKANKANWFDNKVCYLLKKIESKHCLKSVGE